MVVSALFVGACTCCAAYKPAVAPLMAVRGERMTPESAWREYPRPQLVRDGWINLNGLWEYAVTPKNGEQPVEWQGRILVPFSVESALSGVGRPIEPGELLWYRRTFEAQPRKGERLLLHFGAVDFRTQVWVNGVEVTDVPNESGNLPFSLDITEAVKAGANELVLSVWDPSNEGFQSVGKQCLKPHGCMYTRVTGIWQTVWMESVPETHVTGYRVVTDIDAGTVAVTLCAAGNLMAAAAEVEVLREGAVLAKGNVLEWGKPVVLKLKDPLLWSPQAPNLYDLRMSLKSASGSDQVKGYFGMRKHIKIEPLRYYYLCDKMGIMIWQDMVSGWKDGEDRYALYRRELKGMMDLLQTVPSVVMWVPYNEGWGQPGKAKTNMTQAWVKRYDPTRLANGPSGWTDYGVGDARDMHKYPGRRTEQAPPAGLRGGQKDGARDAQGAGSDVDEDSSSVEVYVRRAGRGLGEGGVRRRRVEKRRGRLRERENQDRPSAGGGAYRMGGARHLAPACIRVLRGCSVAGVSQHLL